MTDLLNWFFEHLSYETITFLMTLESTIVPIPSEFVIPPAAYASASGEGLNIWWIVFWGTLGADLGASINYFFSYFIGRPIIYRFANSKWGHLCLLNEEKLQQSERFFIKHGALSTLIGRLIPVIRHLISIPAGLAKMPYWEFLLFTTIGAGVWSTILAALGYYLHTVVPKEQLMEALSSYAHEIKLFFGAILLLAILYFAIKHFLQKRKNRK